MAQEKILGKQLNLSDVASELDAFLPPPDLINDTTPELGGNLDVNNFDIVGKSPVDGNADGGDININGGLAGAIDGDGGRVFIRGGEPINGPAGRISLYAGYGGTDSATNVGRITLEGMNITAPVTGGRAIISGGHAHVGSDSEGGDVDLTAGGGRGTARGGNINLTPAVGFDTGADGAVYIRSSQNFTNSTVLYLEDNTIGGNFVGLRAPNTVGTDVIWTLPNDTHANASGKFLYAAAADGVLSFASGGEAYVVINSSGTLPLAAGLDAVAIGGLSIASFANAVAIGKDAEAINTAATAVGWDAYAGGVNSLALGENSWTGNTEGIAIGHNAEVTANQGIAIGGFNSYIGAAALQAIAIGAGAGCDGYRAIAIGASASSDLTQQIKIGRGVTASAITTDVAHSVAIGSVDVTDKNLLHLFSKGKLELYGDEAQFIAPSYTVATLPPVIAGGMIYVSDASAAASGVGAQCFGRGVGSPALTEWVDVTTGIAVV